MIPEAAVEAAEEALMAAIAYRVNPFMPPRYLDGMGVRGIDAAAVRKRALTAALEAAAPHMLAEAWEAGFERGFYDPLAGSTRDASESAASNPYA